MHKIIFVAFIVLIVCLSWYGIVDYVDYKEGSEIITLFERASYLNSTKKLKAKAVFPLEQMILDAEKDGICLVVVSGFRTLEQQQLLYNDKSKKGLVAKPGTSEHEQGIAVDLGGCPMIDGVRNDNGQRLELRNDFSTLPEYKWLVENAHKYNFEQSYTAENTEETGFLAEEWHWRYTK